MSEPVWKCEEGRMPIEEYEKRLVDAEFRAKKAESENAMLKECIVRMALGRYGVLNSVRALHCLVSFYGDRRPSI